jgi:hypothetical protein
MRDLVSNLPSGQQRPAKNLEEDTVVAILNTIHEIVTDSSENARSLIQAQAIEKLVAINKTRYDHWLAQLATVQHCTVQGSILVQHSVAQHNANVWPLTGSSVSNRFVCLS